MRKIILSVPYAIFLVFTILIVNGFIGNLERLELPLLTTPYGNSAFSLYTHDLGATYFRLLEPSNIIWNGDMNWLYAISPNIAAIIFFQLSVLFLVLYGRIRKLEISYIVFSFLISFQYILYLDYISSHLFLFLFYFASFLINAAFLYLVHSLYNKRTQWSYFFIGMVFSLLLSIIFYPTDAKSEKLLFFIIGIVHMLTFFYSLILLITDMRSPFAFPLLKNDRVRWILGTTSLVIIAVPWLSYISIFFFEIPVTMNKNAIFFLPAIFPMLLLLFSLRYGFISFAVPVHSFFLRVVYYVYFAFLYWFLVGYQIESFLDLKEHIWLHIFYAFVIIFVFDSLRTVSFISINQYLLYRRFSLDEHLSELSRYINNPVQFTDLIEKIREIIILGTGASDAYLFVSEDLFAGWNIEKEYVHFIPANHYFWYSSIKKKKYSYVHYTQATDVAVQSMLQRHGGFLNIFFFQFPMSIMLFEKDNKEPYFTEDLSFVKNLIKNTEPLLENYGLLIKNIRQKRMEKEMERVSGLQRTFIPEPILRDRIQVHSFVQPSLFVTGDYVDIIEKSSNEFLLFLGDVSGHGLASGYLMVCVRSIIRGSVKKKNLDLASLFTDINELLCSKQSSTSIMTLCAIRVKIDKNDKNKIHCSYVNAGHHAPVVYTKNKKKVTLLSGNQRVLGAISGTYTLQEREFSEPIRIILTTDGAFEIFNEAGDFLGEKKFINWIEESILMNLPEQISFLSDKIVDYTGSTEKVDDISMLLADINK